MILRKLTALTEFLAAKPLVIGVILFSLIPFYLTVALIQDNGVNVPYMEQWDLTLPIVQQVEEGQLQLSSLTVQRAEHRVFFTNITSALLSLTTGWTPRSEMFISVGLALINLILLLIIYGLHDPAHFWVVAFPFSLLVFSPMQWENWLWGFETVWFYLVMFILLAFLVLKVFPLTWKSLLVAGLFATCATFSIAVGLMIWPAILVGLWLLGSRRWQHYAVWIAAAMVGLALFFAGYDVPATPEGDSSMSLTMSVHYILVYLSAPLFAGLPEQALEYADSPRIVLLVLVSGGMLLLNSLYLWWQERSFAPLAVWWMMAAIPVGTAAGTFTRRAQIGLFQGLLSRYVTLSNLFWIALIALAMLAMQQIVQKSARRWWETGLIYSNLGLMTVLLGLFMHTSKIAVSNAELVGQLRQKNLECVQAYPLGRYETCLFGVHPVLGLTGTRILALYQSRLGPFEDMVTPYRVRLRYFTYEPLGQQVTTEYRNMVIDGRTREVFFQHAPSKVRIPLRNATGGLIFQSAIYVIPSNVIDHPDIPQDGVTFRVSVIYANASQAVLYEATFDPNIHREPMPFEIHLPVSQEPIIWLILETDSRKNPRYDWAMWVEPMIGEAP